MSLCSKRELPKINLLETWRLEKRWAFHCVSVKLKRKRDWKNLKRKKRRQKRREKLRENREKRFPFNWKFDQLSYLKCGDSHDICIYSLFYFCIFLQDRKEREKKREEERKAKKAAQEEKESTAEKDNDDDDDGNSAELNIFELMKVTHVISLYSVLLRGSMHIFASN